VVLPKPAKVEQFEKAIKAGHKYAVGIITTEIIDPIVEKRMKSMKDFEHY
jgi:hypothetical protein